ncbi:hypothetical protein EII28_11620 [Fusobacterium nucleatum]|uniref:Lipoprotein n=1 Tax=Fusobacterium nucleatum TaxID=851 RepID=A0A3P1VMF5_FUSNU|nr:hypothetical protein [Fusobacterium nucleatum]RRD34746.1 hypothetical protein EII28_11620 [Fusobacterium nucleatum]
MKKLIMLIVLGIMMIGCGKGDNWYKAPYAKETIMAEGKIDETQITADNVQITVMFAPREFENDPNGLPNLLYFFETRMKNNNIVEMIITNNFKFDKLNELLKNYDYVIVPYTEEEYNKMLDDVNIKDNPKLKDETDLYMFKLVPKKYIK